MYCPPNSQFVFSEKFRFAGSGSLDGDMLPTRASSGSAATPAAPIRLAWISARREMRRLPLASPSGGAVPSRARLTALPPGAGVTALRPGAGVTALRPGAGVTALPPGAGADGVAPGRRAAVPGRGDALPGLPGRGGAPAGAAVPALAGR